MGLRRKDPLLVAVIVTGIYSLSWGIIGTKDLEEQFNGAFSYAASFRNTVFSSAPEFGKHTYLGVPVYDTSVGMGYRLPFLYGANHSPFVLLRYFLSTQVIQFVVVAIASLFATTALNLMYKSWSPAGSRRSEMIMLALLDVAVLGPTTIYLFVNDWSTQAAQYFGALAIASSLFEKIWFCGRGNKPLQIPRIKITITIGIILLFMGHQGNVPNFLGLILIPLTFHLYSRKIAWQDRKIVIFLLGISAAAFIPSALDVFIESTKQPFARITAANWYSFSPSIDGIWYFFKQLVFSNSWPVSSLLRSGLPSDVDESSKGFLGLVSIVLVIGGSIFMKKSRPFLVALILLVSCFMLAGIHSAAQSHLGALASSAAWQLRDTLLIISTLMLALFAAALRTSAVNQVAKKILQVGTLIAVCLSAIFPIAVIGIQVKNSGYSNGVILKVISQENTDWIETLRGAGVREGDRIYIANQDLFRYADWLGYEKLPQFVELGVSTINGWPKIRAAFTLAKNQAGFEARFYNVIDSRFGCRPHELDFLAVDWVIDSNGECQEEYLNEFSEENVKIFRVGKNVGVTESKNVYLYRINQTHIYKVNNHKHGVVVGPCALLVEDNCLGKLGVNSENIEKKYFKLCLRKCIAKLQWYFDEPENAMIVPLDFQPFLKVENTRTKQELKVSSSNGLLRIEPGAHTDYGDPVTISMRPDQLMMISAVSTWASTIALVSLCMVTVLKKSLDKKRLHSQ